MPRSSGTMSIVNSFSPSTTISSSQVNANFTDIASEITNSLALDGQSTMTAPLKSADGTEALPGITWGGDPNTGFYRSGADTFKAVTGGTTRATFSSAGIDATALLVAGSAVAVTGSANLFTALQKFSKGVDIASASPLVIGTDGNYFDVTGTTGFSAMTVAAGALFVLQFDGALTITHGASINLPGAVNFTTAAGDELLCYATAANTVRVLAVNSVMTQAQAEAGTSTKPQLTTALRQAQAITALAPSVGSLVLIQAQNPAAVASVDFTSGIDSTYEIYKIIGRLLPATDNVKLYLRTDSNAGASFDAGASDYIYANDGIESGAGTTQSSGAAAFIDIGSNENGANSIGNLATEGLSFEITMFHPANSSRRPEFTWQCVSCFANGEVGVVSGAGVRDAGAAINAFRLLFSSGNIASGHVALYGLKKA